jgi:hypothetical protein
VRTPNFQKLTTPSIVDSWRHLNFENGRITMLAHPNASMLAHPNASRQECGSFKCPVGNSITQWVIQLPTPIWPVKARRNNQQPTGYYINATHSTLANSQQATTSEVATRRIGNSQCDDDWHVHSFV